MPKTYNWYYHAKPLMYDVKCNNTVVLPKGTRGVKIAFGQSHLTYTDPTTGRQRHMNVYSYNGNLYHA